MKNSMSQGAGSVSQFEILLIDNDPVTCMIQSNRVQKFFPGPIIIFSDLNQVLDYLRSHDSKKKKFLVFLEIFIPEKDGWEFLEVCSREMQSKIKVAVLSFSVSRQVREKALSYKQVVAYFEKPLMNDHLLSLVDKIADP